MTVYKLRNEDIFDPPTAAWYNAPAWVLVIEDGEVRLQIPLNMMNADFETFVQKWQSGDVELLSADDEAILYSPETLETLLTPHAPSAA